MNKEVLLYYWYAVKAVTDSLAHPNKNEWATKHNVKHVFYHIGFDEVVIYYCRNEIIIAINGSDGDLNEWESNFDAYPIEDNTHKSFREHGIQIYNTINELISLYIMSTTPITIVGHSRGGALAQVLAEKLEYKCRVITYGSPRLYTIYKKKKDLNYTHIMVYSIYDPVHRIPFVFMIPWFKHFYTKKIKIKKRIHHEFSHTHYGELIEKFL